MATEQASGNANTSDGDGKNTGGTAAGEPQSSKSQKEDSESQAGKTFTQAEFDAYAERTRKELKKDFEKQLKDAELSEAERTAKRVQELEKEIRLRDAKETVAEAARKAGAANTAAVYKLTYSMLEFDDAGKVSNLRDVIDAAKADAPELFPKRPGSGNGGSGNEGSSGSFSRNMNDLIRRSAGRQ
jgi:hypothetical protein